jgi:hypothetical protein
VCKEEAQKKNKRKPGQFNDISCRQTSRRTSSDRGVIRKALLNVIAACSLQTDDRSIALLALLALLDLENSIVLGALDQHQFTIVHVHLCSPLVWPIQEAALRGLRDGPEKADRPLCRAHCSQTGRRKQAGDNCVMWRAYVCVRAGFLSLAPLLHFQVFNDVGSLNRTTSTPSKPLCSTPHVLVDIHYKRTAIDIHTIETTVWHATRSR